MGSSGAADERIIESGEFAKTGQIDLTFAEIEAGRGLATVETDLTARKNRIFSEILERAPQGAVLKSLDLDQGTATWSTG